MKIITTKITSLIIVIIFVFTIIVPLTDSISLNNKGKNSQIYFSQNNYFLKSLSQADLQLIRFESWWSNKDNGTLYIRYLVKNVGQTTHSSNPLGLNISISEKINSEPLFYINQSLLFPFSYILWECSCEILRAINQRWCHFLCNL